MGVDGFGIRPSLGLNHPLGTLLPYILLFYVVHK